MAASLKMRIYFFAGYHADLIIIDWCRFGLLPLKKIYLEREIKIENLEFLYGFQIFSDWFYF